jgi:hypothetical protein
LLLLRRGIEAPVVITPKLSLARAQHIRTNLELRESTS